MEYYINEGNRIGYLPAEFGENITLDQKKLVASTEVKKGQVVEVSGDMTVAPTSAASAKVLGVAMFDAKADEHVVVETEGLFKLVANASITAGDIIESAADGKVAKVGASAVKPLGVALNTVTTGGNVYVKFSI